MHTLVQVLNQTGKVCNDYHLDLSMSSFLKTAMPAVIPFAALATFDPPSQVLNFSSKIRAQSIAEYCKPKSSVLERNM